MHLRAAAAIVASVRRRVSLGDHPIEPTQSVETLEDCLLTLADEIERLRAQNEQHVSQPRA